MLRNTSNSMEDIWLKSDENDGIEYTCYQANNGDMYFCIRFLENGKYKMKTIRLCTSGGQTPIEVKRGIKMIIDYISEHN